MYLRLTKFKKNITSIRFVLVPGDNFVSIVFYFVLFFIIFNKGRFDAHFLVDIMYKHFLKVLQLG